MQWFLVMGETPSTFNDSGDCDDHIFIDSASLCPNNPVESVSWNDVQVYIDRLNEGLSGCDGNSSKKGCYRLPTEAEWEFAARGGRKSASFGDSFSRLGEYAWYSGNSDGRPHPVGLKKANPYGLYDVHGNVWEWVQDAYRKKLPGGTNPFRVVRGGGWNFSARDLRSANRSFDGPDYGYGGVGFRLVRNL